MSGEIRKGIVSKGSGYCDDCVEQDGDAAALTSDPCHGHAVYEFDLGEHHEWRASKTGFGDANLTWLCGEHIHLRMTRSTSANVTIDDDGAATADGFTFQF
jgi:hypothetical protein